MPENYGQGYGGYPQPQQQGQGMPPQQMQGQQPYGYGQAPMNGMQYGYPGGQPPKKGLGIGAIIGIVVGVLALIGMLGFVVLGPAMRGNGGNDTDDTTTSQRRDDEDTTDTSTQPSSDGTDDTTASQAGDGQGQGGTSAPSGGSQSGIAVDINNLADDWTLGEVNLAGRGYRLFESTYGDLVANGWMIDKYDMEKIRNNGNALVINANEWTTFTFENPAYPDEHITVGLGNLTSGPINYDQCVITYLAAHLSYSNGELAYDRCYDFAISKGAKLGTTDTEVLALFGQPDEDGSIYEDDASGFKSIRYTVIGEGEALNRNYYHLEFQFTRTGDGLYHAKDITIGV